MSTFDRFREILAQVAHYGFADLLEEVRLIRQGRKLQVIEPPDKLRAHNLRLLLQELGPTTIKLGQLLSTRPDLLGPEYIAELSNLQDEGPHLSFHSIRQVIAEELGATHTIFASIDCEPLAAASLAQVHRACLLSGEEVVIKVQRPHVAEQVAQDLPVLRRMAGLLAQYSSYADVFDFTGIIEQLEKSLCRELDFCFELASMERLRENLTEYPHLVIPQSYPQYSTRRVLTMEYIRGHKINHCENNPMLARELLECYVQQVAIDGYYHADPHPGNALVTEDGNLALLDFGMIGVVDARTRQGIAMLMLEVVNQRGDRVAEELVRLGDPTPEFELARFKREMSSVLEHYQFLYGRGPNIGELMVEMIQKSRLWHLKSPPEFTLLSKTLMQVDDLSRKLDPTINPSEVVTPKLQEALFHSLKESLSWPILLGTLLDTVELATNSARRLNLLSERLVAEDKVRLQFEHIGLEGFYRQVGKVGNRLAVAVIIGALFLFSSNLIQQPPPFNYLALIAGILGVFLTLFVFVTVSKSREF